MDISGFWAGTYIYPNDMLPPVKFDAEISQNSIMVRGHITEDNTFDFMEGTILSASIAGHLAGNSIYFIKTYANTGQAKHVVYYNGIVSDDGTQITGSWEVFSVGGKFEMRRDQGRLEKANVPVTKVNVGLPVKPQG